MNFIQKLNDIFEKLSIKTMIYEHKPVFSLEESDDLKKEIPGASCKSLFLKDNNKKLWMLVAVGEAKVPLKAVAKMIGAPGLRFCNAEMMMDYLGVAPGSVSPFALINDKQHEIAVILDDRLFEYDLAGFHPLDNSKTITISPDDLLKVLDFFGNDYSRLAF